MRADPCVAGRSRRREAAVRDALEVGAPAAFLQAVVPSDWACSLDIGEAWGGCSGGVRHVPSRAG